MRVRKSDAATTDAVGKPEGARTNRLTDISVKEVSIVDRAANERKYLVIKDLPGGAPPPHPPAVPAPGTPPPAAALQIAPELKAKVLGVLKAAQDRITGVAKALETAVETPGAVVPPALVEAFDALGSMFELGTPAAPPAPAAKEDASKAGRKISAARLAQLLSAKTALDSIIADVADAKDDADDKGDDDKGVTKAEEPVIEPSASPELAEIKTSLAALGDMLGKLTLVFEGQNQRIDSLTKARGESRQVDLDKATPKQQPVVWDLDMASPLKTVQ